MPQPALPGGLPGPVRKQAVKLDDLTKILSAGLKVHDVASGRVPMPLEATGRRNSVPTRETQPLMGLETPQPAPIFAKGRKLTAAEASRAAAAGLQAKDILEGKVPLPPPKLLQRRNSMVGNPADLPRPEAAYAHAPRLVDHMRFDHSVLPDENHLLNSLLKLAGPQIQSKLGTAKDTAALHQAMRQKMALHLMDEFESFEMLDAIEEPEREELKGDFIRRHLHMKTFTQAPAELVNMESHRNQEDILDALGPEALERFLSLSPERRTHVFNAAVTGPADGAGDAMAYLAASAFGVKLAVVTEESTELKVLSPDGASGAPHRMRLKGGHFLPAHAARPLVDEGLVRRMRAVPDDGNCFLHSLIYQAKNELAAKMGIDPGQVTPQNTRRHIATPLVDQLVQYQQNMFGEKHADNVALLKEFPYLQSMQDKHMAENREGILDFDDPETEKAFELAVGPANYEKCGWLTPGQKTNIYNVAMDKSWNSSVGDIMLQLTPQAFPKLSLSVLTDATTAESLDASSAGDRDKAEKHVALYLSSSHYVPVLGEEASKLDGNPLAMAARDFARRFPVTTPPVAAAATAA
jgi:hypothetical protein